VTDFSKYVRAGWSICALDPKHKGPKYANWQSKGIAVDAAAELDGAGLLHSLSKTCALDIDDLGAARAWLAERGVDVDAEKERRTRRIMKARRYS